MSHQIRITQFSADTDDDAPVMDMICVGDGGIEHWLQTFRAAMIAAGFPLSVVRRVKLGDGDE